MISIILVEPEEEGNIGAIARLMKNFGFTDLILVNPKCHHLSETAMNRARHADIILKKAKVVKTIPKMHTIIATTARSGDDYNVPRAPLSPEQLADILPKKANIGIVFGRESSGLTNDEIQQCDFCVIIPTNKDYKALNLSHAVGIILYELYQKSKEKKPHEEITPASQREKEQVLILLNSVLGKLSFETLNKKLTQKKVWKRILGKSFLTKREAYTLMGFLKKVIKKFK